MHGIGDFFQTLMSSMNADTFVSFLLLFECRRVFLPRRMHGPVGRDTGTNSTGVGNYPALPGNNKLNFSKNYQKY